MNRALSLALVIGLAATVPASAAETATTLGSDAVLRVRSGRYGDLFPNAPKAKVDNSVLAFETIRGGKIAERVVVPGTDGAEVESAPYVIYQDALETSFVLWQTKFNGAYSQFFLASFAAGRWSTPISLTTELWSTQTTPQIAVTTDTYSATDEAGNQTQHRRTVVHTVWWEDIGGEVRTVYSPVVLIDGVYVGWNPQIVLDELDNSGAVASSAVEPSLYRAPALTEGDRAHAVVASFARPDSGRLLNVEIEVLPWQLSQLAASLRLELSGLVEKGSTPQNLADKARAHILIAGAKWFNPRFVESLANETYAHVLTTASAPPGGITALPGEARAHVLIAGSELSGHSLLSDAARRSIEMRLNAEDADPTLTFQVRALANLPAPATATGPTRILAAGNGEGALVAWESQADQISYRESDALSWSDIKTVTLGPQLDREHAYEMLERRARGL